MNTATERTEEARALLAGLGIEMPDGNTTALALCEDAGVDPLRLIETVGWETAVAVPSMVMVTLLAEMVQS